MKMVRITKHWFTRVSLGLALAISNGCEENPAIVDQNAAPAVAVNFFYDFNYTTPNDGVISEEIGIWMHKPDELSVEAISKWLDKKYAPQNETEKKTLYEPINVMWIDFTTDGFFDSRENVESFLKNNGFFSEGPFSPDIPKHSDGYSSFFNATTNFPANQAGETWVDTKWPAENNHGRIFESYPIVTNMGTPAYVTLGAFSREGKAAAAGIPCIDYIPGPCHEFISFNQARDALGLVPQWKTLPNPSDPENADLFHFGNEFPYDVNRDFWTGDHDGVRIFVKYKCPTRFQDNGDGTVTDNTTGLVWLKDARCIEPPTYCYEDAVIASQGLGSGQCDLGDGSSPGDWRLPSIEEWQALLSPEGWECGRPFINIPSQGTYWSSTQSPSDTLINKVIYFGDGQVYEDWNDCRGAGFGRAFAWPVR